MPYMGCCVSKTPGGSGLMQEVNSTSRVKKLTGRFTHSVIGWSGVQRNVGDHLESPQVELCGQKWKMRIFPGACSDYEIPNSEKGGSSFKHSSYVSMYLANRSSTAVSASYQLYIKNQLINEDELVFTSVGVKQFEVQGQGKIDGWGRDRFLPHDRISRESGILLNDTVIFAIEITVYGEIENYSTTVNSGSTLDQDLRFLLKNGKSTADVTLIAGEKEYSLHRCILSARSPVFRAMLENPTREKDSGVIVLQEDDPETIEHFVSFLYSDYLSEKVLQNLCRELYILASKYQVPLLASACEQAMMAYVLDIPTAVALLQFADLYGTITMQNYILRYFDQNIDFIIQSEGYQSLSKEEKERLHLKVSEGVKNAQKEKQIEKCTATSTAGRFSVCCLM